MKRSVGDHAHSLAKTLLSLVPVVGGAASELFQLIIQPPLQRRQIAWLASLAESIGELQDAVESLTDMTLSENEGFVSTLLHASRLAVCTHQSEKLEALRNAVLNAALPSPPSDDLKSIFLGMVDRMTPTHLCALRFLQDPRRFAAVNGVHLESGSCDGPEELLQLAFPSLAESPEGEELASQVAWDLEDMGLVDWKPRISTEESRALPFEYYFSSSATMLLEFISPPELLKGESHSGPVENNKADEPRSSSPL